MTGTDICGYASMLSRPGGTTLRGLANAHQRACYSLLPTSAKGLPRRTSKKSFITFIQLRATVRAWDWQSAVRSSSHTAAVDQRKHRIELDPLRLLRPEIDQPDAIRNGRKRSRSSSSAKPRSPSLLELQYWAWRRRPRPAHCGHRAPVDRGPLSRDAGWGDRAE
jgi:hypothetical protein